uniref:Protein Wnt n=1 Tax=Anopheles maculatus TaxID=74869 RepID=A0A182SW09_9DIPT
MSQQQNRGIAKAGEPNNISPLAPGMTYLDPAIHATLRRKQRRLARENPGVLAAIAKGANLAINECQHQFRTRRWNCSTRNFLRGKNLFGKIVERGVDTSLITIPVSASRRPCGGGFWFMDATILQWNARVILRVSIFTMKLIRDRPGKIVLLAATDRQAHVKAAATALVRFGLMLRSGTKALFVIADFTTCRYVPFMISVGLFARLCYFCRVI